MVLYKQATPFYSASCSKGPITCSIEFVFVLTLQKIYSGLSQNKAVIYSGLVGSGPRTPVCRLSFPPLRWVFLFLLSSRRPVAAAADEHPRRDHAPLGTLNPNPNPDTSAPFAMEEPSLAPPRDPLAAAPSAALSRRRAHLDSASYRALSRLFSHCLHLHPPPHAARSDADGERAAAAITPPGGSGGLPSGGSPPPKDLVCDGGKDLEVEVALGNPTPHETPSASVSPDAAANPNTDPGVAPEGTPESGVAGVERVESVEEVVLAGSTSGKDGADGEELGAGSGLMGDDEALRSMQACLDGDNNELVSEIVGNDDEQLQLDAMMTNLSGRIDDASAGLMSAQSGGASGGKLQDDGRVAEEVKELGAGIGYDRSVVSSDHGSIDGCFEEGEIEGDMQNLDADDSGNSEHEGEDVAGEELEQDFVSRRKGENESCGQVIKSHSLHLIPQKGNGDFALNKQCDSNDGSQMHVARAQAVSYDEVVDWNETPLPDDKALKQGNKRKRAFTEERKAKKTKNKRIKRALQREAEGVKRLKLQPVIKPKVVQDCRFYLLGKCQQGNMCKFSHDSTPLTKSKPCTHFARGSCLKGDDCPYDHELSKYPCHNFMENGMCIRGDKCKFSHVTPTAEAPSTVDAKNSNASSVPEKTNCREQPSSQKISTVYSGEPTSAPTKHHSILKNLAGLSGNAQKIPVHVPKGIQFLPFNKASVCIPKSILHRDVVSTEKHKEPSGSQGENIANHNGLHSAPLLDEKNTSKQANLHPCSEPKKYSLPTTAVVVPSSASTQHEVSEASRILQEFLFGAGN
uniref:C3H1-type domain-containing protein n=1 Tax=Leersia perrieri TaxID=77586 RepID=A0A0D9V257_9ORYZ